MDEVTKRKVEKGIAWFGPLFVVGYFYFWGYLGHNIPPPNAVGMTGEQLVAEYYGKYPEIKLGMIVSAAVGLFYMPWSCLLASLLRERDGSMGVLSLMELTGGLLTGWLLAFCPAIWCACAMMVGHVDPEIIKFVHLGTWLIFDCTYMITTIQLLGLGLYVVLNRQQSIFPSWSGWCALAVGAGFIPLTLVPFVTEGPFVIPGIWNYFIVFGSWFFAFFCVFSYFVLKHVYRAEGTSAQAVPGARASV